VRSIVGRFLEHTRVFYFENGGDPLVYLSSADWMGRNFFNRVEVCVPIEDKRLKRRLISESFQLYLADSANAWTLLSDGTYKRLRAPANKRRSAQESLLQELSACAN
jgi:polyphosphate kinase